MKLRISCVGKLKERALVDWVDEYVKRSRRFFPIDIDWVRDMDALRGRAVTPNVVLDERGKSLTTQDLADWLADRRDRGTREISFQIGDAHGFSQGDRDGADLVLALSAFTLPHRLAQVMLVEQLYRAGTVVFGHPYHHE